MNFLYVGCGFGINGNCIRIRNVWRRSGNMKPTSKMYCIQCKKTTDHVPYIEDDTINYNGVMVEFTDKGFICSVCGSQNCTPEQYDEVMQEIRENYELTWHR